MILHQFKNAWRAIRNHKLYAMINVLGLVIGLTSCIVIYLIAQYDLSFDKFHPDGDRIYRIVEDLSFKNGNTVFLNCPVKEIAGIEHAIPGFEQQVGFHTFSPRITVPGPDGRQLAEFDGTQQGTRATSVIFTGPEFFDLFPHRWLAGGPAVLREPNRVVLSENAAATYFGRLRPDEYLGKTIIYADSLPVIVSGIVKDWTGLSDLAYSSFISISTAPNSWVRAMFPTADWTSLRPHQSQAFVKLARGVTSGQVNAALSNYIKKFQGKLGPPEATFQIYLQPLTEIHYNSQYLARDDGDDFPKAYLPLLYVLIGVAVFILVLAIINFINLSTAQSLQRIKEVGIRKVMGSSRRGLILQFLFETLMVCGLAIVISLLLVRPALTLFRDYIPAGVHFFVNMGVISFLVAMLVITTLAAGFYPAKLLSAYKPVESLKGAIDNASIGGVGIRKTLITFQFTISLLFIIGSLIIGRQVRFMHDADKGFNDDAIVTMDIWRAKPEQVQLLGNRIRRIAGVKEVLLQNNTPMGYAHSGTSLIYRGKELKNTSVMLQSGGGRFIPFYGIKLLAGRNIAGTDSSREMLINETYSRELGFAFPADAVGRLLYEDTIAYSIVGVTADFHQESFHETIKPEVIVHLPQHEVSMSVMLDSRGRQGANVRAIIASIELEFKTTFPKRPFYWSFLSDSLASLYGQESNMAFLMQSAMVLTILISCLGLFGLALFTTGRREKEIGIRKVLGASVSGIVALLTREFLTLVMLALAFASPVAWYLGTRWLQGFAYRTSLSPIVFLGAGLLGILLVCLTIGFLAMRAARRNPIMALRRE